MKEDKKTKPAEVEPNDSQRNDEALSAPELAQISGGIDGIKGESQDERYKNN